MEMSRRVKKKGMTETYGFEGITTVPLNSYVSDSMRRNAGFLP